MILKKRPFLEIIFLLVISAIVFLPNIGRLTYFKDDWYYIYDGLIAGAKVFHPMFSIDRPARGYFFEIYYSFFGPHPFPYHVGAYLWRVFAAIGALWLFNILWPKERKFAFFTTLLFVLYPGYFWWISAIEYQPMIASLALQAFSIALTLKAIQSSGLVSRVSYLIGAIITGWIYIALVDYAIGVELFRFLCVYVLVTRDAQFSTMPKKVIATFKVWVWNLVIPLGFVWWRTFIFSNERKATDVGLQLEVLFNSPISTASNWFLHFFNSLLNLSMMAWVVQFQRFFFKLRLLDMVYGCAVVVIVLLLVFLVDRLMEQSIVVYQEISPKPSANPYREALLIGMPGMMFGILPVILANRYINLGIYSHYGLPASLPATIFLTGLIYVINSKQVRFVSICILIMLATLAHYSIPKYTLIEENAIATYWWQVSWRAPGLRPDTTLVTLYPIDVGDNNYREVPNMIYYPEYQQEIPVRYPLSAVPTNDQNAERIIIGKLRKLDGYRSHEFLLDYGNVLVISQPTSASCVHVIDGARYLLSESDPENIKLIAPYSRIDNVRVNVEPRIPQAFAFGAEPAHNWCFYFEKAELAVQKLDWNEAARLGDNALRLELHPEDQAEWFPFLEAYVVLGNEKNVKTLSSEIITHEFLRDQACSIFNESDFVLVMNSHMKSLVADLFCK